MLTKQEIIESLKSWNFWDKQEIELKERTNYKEHIKKLRKGKEIIVLKGIRRSGKSTLLKQEIKDIIENTDPKQILFINLEEPKFISNLNISLLDRILEAYKEYLEPDSNYYIFLDEIQNIPSWEKWVRKIYETEDVNIYVTGSSSKLLSKEFATSLTGRYFSVLVYPLSFREFLAFKNLQITKKYDLISKKNQIKKLFMEFIKWGGFPKVVLQEKELLKKETLDNYFESIIIRDVVTRHNLDNTQRIEELVKYMVSNISNRFSINKITRAIDLSYNSLKKYIDFIKETYMFFELKKFDYSLKKQMLSQSKIYCIDPGIINATSFNFSKNIGKTIENLVFIELKKLGCEIYYYKDKHECDFVIKEKNKIVKAIQVTWEFHNKNKERKIKGLLEAMNKFNLKEGLILTNDQEKTIQKNNKTIYLKPIWKWLILN